MPTSTVILDGLVTSGGPENVAVAGTDVDQENTPLHLGLTVEQFRDNWKVAVEEWEELCDASEGRSDATFDCPAVLPLLDSLESSSDSNGIQTWSQDLLLPARFVGTEVDGAMKVVNVRAFEPATSSSERLVQMALLCQATYGQNSAQLCGDHVNDLFKTALASEDTVINVSAERQGVNWLLSYFRDGMYSLRGSSDPNETTVTTLDRTTTYPEHLIVEEIHEFWTSLAPGVEMELDTATTLASLRAICPEIDKRAVMPDPVFDYWQTIENEVPERGIRRLFAFQIDQAVVHYCPEYQDEWRPLYAEIRDQLD